MGFATWARPTSLRHISNTCAVRSRMPSEKRYFVTYATLPNGCIRSFANCPAAERSMRLAFLDLSVSERALYFEQTSLRRGLHPAIMEKDFWVCWLLRLLFADAEFN